MSEENSLLTPETIEKIISTPEILRLLLNTESENYSITDNGKELAINFLLCEVVMENVFAGCPKFKKDLDNYNRITIYFKPRFELKTDIRCKENADNILNLLKKVNRARQKLTQHNDQIEKIRTQWQQQITEIAVLEAKIFNSARDVKLVPKKPINRRYIAIKKRELMNLSDELSKVYRTSADINKHLKELMQTRVAMEDEINANIDALLGMLLQQYKIEKIGLS